MANLSEISNLMAFIPSYLTILVVGLYVIGIFLKRSEVKDKLIPIILMICSISIAVALTIVNAENKVTLAAIINGLLQGVMCWGASVGINQLYVQSKKAE